MMKTLAVSILSHFRRAKIPFPMALFESGTVSKEEADIVPAKAGHLVRGAIPKKNKSPE